MISRKGRNLSVPDIFGLANQLKETRSCKIIFVFNKDGLGDDEKKSFDLYFEKVIDASVDFDPTSEEAVEIALPEVDELSQWLRVNCIDLNISNIRIIRRILRAAAQFNEIVVDVGAEIRRDMVRSLTLLAWAVFVPKDAPAIDFISGWGYAQWVGLDKKQATAEENAWARILRQYNFTNFDDLDRSMVDGIRKGYFDEGSIRPEVKKMEETRRKVEGDAGLHAAWRRYHDSFDQDEEAVANELFDGIMRHMRYLSPLNLNAAYTILNNIGYPDKVDKLLETFIQENADTPSVFDLKGSPFGGDVNNLKIREAFEPKQRLTGLPFHPRPKQRSRCTRAAGRPMTSRR
jgi:hypothetical protein